MKFSRKNNEHYYTKRYFVSKNRVKSRFILLIILGSFVFNMNSFCLYAQKAKKNKARLSVQYVKIIDGETYFDIKASSRINKKNVTIPNIEINIYNELDDERLDLGKTITNKKGESRFKLKNLNLIKPDSTQTYNILFSFKGNESFKKAKKSISFKDVELKARIISKDSLNFISATLIDPNTGSPITGQGLTVQVQRLFRPLQIGEEFIDTDETGTIEVPVEAGIPGVDGILTFEVVLNDSDEYGTVKAMVKAPIGIPIVDKSTFDQRTMWSPRNKTPLFLLIFPNLIIFGIWGIIIYLILNLFKLSKS